MSEKTLNTTIQLRHDSAANWAETTRILKAGEVGVDLTNGKIKVGDGVKTWANLKYVGGDEAAVYQVEPESGETDLAAIARVVGVNELHPGDSAIVKRVIANDKKAYTAYVYEKDTGWKAMDGNYDAENVYFKDDIVVTTKVGTIQTLTNGSATWNTAGKNVKQALMGLLAEEKQPSVTNPSANFKTWSLSKAAGNYEAGTLIEGTASYELQLSSAGSYTYGPATGVTDAGIYSLSYSTDNTTGAATTGSKATKSGSFDYSFRLGDNTKYVKVTAASVKHTASTANANTNLGNETDKSIAENTISAGTKSESFTGFRYWYLGGLNNTGELTSAMIKGLTAKQSGSGINGDYKASSYNGGVIKRFVIAIPHSANKNVTKVLLKSASNADITTEFKKQTDMVSVAGASGSDSSYNADYDIWIYEPASLDSTEEYTITIG